MNSYQLRDFIQENAGLIMGITLFFFILCILLIVCQWIIYSKARQPGWACIIPFYNVVILLKIVGKPVSWIFWYLQIIFFYILLRSSPDAITGLLYLVSAITLFVFSIIVTNGLSKSFGKDAGFTAGLIFLPMIFYPILAFGKAQYIGPGGKPEGENPTE